MSWFIVIIALVICLGDFILYVVLGHNYTISATIQLWGQRWPMLTIALPFFMGLLCGHFFWWPLGVVDESNTKDKK